ncbi:MAG: thioredoxin domain-containing protein [Candidatus Woesearchaeota archaeon]
MPIQNADKLDFDKDVLGSSLPVALSFTTLWDSACRSFSQSFEELSAEYEGKILFFNSNIDGNPDLAEQLGVSRVPTVVLLFRGKEFKRMFNPSKPFLKSELDAILRRSRVF